MDYGFDNSIITTLNFLRSIAEQCKTVFIVEK